MSFYYTSYQDFKQYVLNPLNFSSFKDYLITKKHEITIEAFENGLDEENFRIFIEAFTIASEGLTEFQSENSVYSYKPVFIIDLFLFIVETTLELFCIRFKLEKTISDLKSRVDLIDIFDIVQILLINQISFQISLLDTSIDVIVITTQKIEYALQQHLEYIFKSSLTTTIIPDRCSTILESYYYLGLQLDDKILNNFILKIIQSDISDYTYCKSIEKISHYNYPLLFQKITINDYLNKLISLFNRDSTNGECIYIIVTSMNTIDSPFIKNLLKIAHKDVLIRFIETLLQLITNITETPTYLSELYGLSFEKNLSGLLSFNEVTIDKLIQGIYLLFDVNPELCDTYLLRKIPLIFLQLFNKERMDRPRNFLCSKIFSLMDDHTPYFKLYLASIFDDKLIGSFNKFFYEIVKETVNRFKELLEKDTESQFIDNISGTFIIIPAVIRNGDQKIWVDKYVMMASLAINPINPYTREPLTIEMFEESNNRLKEEIDEYDQKRREFIVAN